MQAPLRGLARVYSISPSAKCVSDFLMVVTKCQAGTREEDLCGFWLEGIPSVMAGEAWWQAVEGQQPAAACYRAPKQEAESWAGCDSQCTSFSPPPRPECPTDSLESASLRGSSVQRHTSMGVTAHSNTTRGKHWTASWWDRASQSSPWFEKNTLAPRWEERETRSSGRHGRCALASCGMGDGEG